MLNHEKPQRVRGAIAVVKQDQRLLVIRRSQHVAAPGMICFPGGAIEGEETEPEALRREMQEELFVQAQPIRRLWRSVTSWNVDLSWWLAEIEPEASLRANPLEVSWFGWLSSDDLLGQPDLLESNRQFLSAWQNGEFEL